MKVLLAISISGDLERSLQGLAQGLSRFGSRAAAQNSEVRATARLRPEMTQRKPSKTALRL